METAQEPRAVETWPDFSSRRNCRSLCVEATCDSYRATFLLARVFGPFAEESISPLSATHGVLPASRRAVIFMHDADGVLFTRRNSGGESPPPVGLCPTGGGASPRGTVGWLVSLGAFGRWPPSPLGRQDGLVARALRSSAGRLLLSAATGDLLSGSASCFDGRLRRVESLRQRQICRSWWT